MKIQWVLCVCLAFALGVPAQEVVIERKFGVRGGPGAGATEMGFQRGGDGVYVSAGAAGHGLEFMKMEIASTGRTVTGAPYTAEAVTETVQTLSDGNRITRRHTARLARDSEGRTRRQEKLGGGPLAKAGEGIEMILISDPVAEVHYSFNTQNRIANKTSFRAKKVMEAGREIAIEKEMAVGFATMQMKAPAADPTRVKSENLGKRSIEGVIADGTRTTTTIPAGEIGNDRPIEIFYERWFSPELQMVVLTRNVDPRMGEMTYKVTNLQRGEPSRTLFEVPAEYTIKESGEIMKLRISHEASHL